MSTQRYSVTPHPIETLLTWVKSGEIAIPEIQRPFVWEATQVRNLLDSLYQGYPVGYLIAWRNPTVKLKDGSTSAGKRILIDGQQRVTALMAALLGTEVLTEDYETVQIRIAFNPQDEKFEVANPAIRKNPAWLPDVAAVFAPQASMFQLVSAYCEANPGSSQDAVFKVIERLRGIVHNHVGVILAFISETHFDRFTMILRSAGFITSDMITSQNAVNFAYIVYLRGRKEQVPAAELEQLVRRWYAMSVLRGRYSGSPESQFDFDIRQIDSRGVEDYVNSVIPNELPDSFWTGMLPQFMDTSSIKSPYFLCYKAAQVKLGDKGFLSRDITVRDLLLNRADVHHVFPRQYLKDKGLTSGSYNQIANYVIAQSEINIAIGAKAPLAYFDELHCGEVMDEGCPQRAEIETECGACGRRCGHLV